MGMSQLAERTGLSRPALYRALSREGNPAFSTIIRVAQALGFTLNPVPVTENA